MDFTIKIYKNLLEALLQKGYIFRTYLDYSLIDQSKISANLPLCILRHDVDLRPHNSLITARLEKNLGIRSTYYFRTIPTVFNADLIKEIESLGHEIGYHYETMDSTNGNIDKAFEEFCKNLEMFRKISPVKTICMHGSPLSQFDNKEIWRKYSYKDLGIIGEPYLDIDWNEFGYLTDTGRRWDGSDVSVRDKVGIQDKRQREKEKSFIQDKRLKACPESIEGEKEKSLEQWNKFKDQLKSTQDIINNIDSLPDKIMITVHPQRWTDAPLPWVKELVLQNLKNVVKRFLIKTKD